MLNDILYRELISEKAAVWFIPDGNNLELRIKAPTITLMAIIQGAIVHFIFGQELIAKNLFLTYACVIEDDSTNPCIISGIIRRRQEQDALISILQGTKIIVVLYNELDMPVAWTNNINHFSAEHYIEWLESKDFYCGGNVPEQEIALDNLGKEVKSNIGSYTTNNYKQLFYIKTADWNFFKITSFIRNIPISDQLDASDEGSYLEKLVAIAIDAIFPATTCKNPIAENNTNQRELTDIFAFYDKGIFLFETKALSALKDNYRREMRRKIVGVKKQIRKAVKQLQGAVNAIKRGDIIKNIQGEIISFDRTLTPHCLIVVSEIFHVADEEIFIDLYKASRDNHCFFHIIDLKNLLMLVKSSCHETLRPERFDYALIGLFEHVIKEQTINIEIRLDVPYSKE